MEGRKFNEKVVSTTTLWYLVLREFLPRWVGSRQQIRLKSLGFVLTPIWLSTKDPVHEFFEGHGFTVDEYARCSNWSRFKTGYWSTEIHGQIIIVLHSENYISFKRVSMKTYFLKWTTQQWSVERRKHLTGWRYATRYNMGSCSNPISPIRWE